MFRRSSYMGLYLALPILFNSCLEEHPTAPQGLPETGWTVQIAGLDSAYFAQESGFGVAAFNLIVTDSSDIPVPEAPIMVWVDAGPGEVFLLSDQTDVDGRLKALFYAHFPLFGTTAVLCATAGGDTAQAEIFLKPLSH